MYIMRKLSRILRVMSYRMRNHYKFIGLHSEPYRTYEELCDHYRNICIELHSMYNYYMSLPECDNDWCQPLLESLKTVLNYIAENTENDDLTV